VFAAIPVTGEKAGGRGIGYGEAVEKVVLRAAAPADGQQPAQNQNIQTPPHRIRSPLPATARRSSSSQSDSAPLKFNHLLAGGNPVLYIVILKYLARSTGLTYGSGPLNSPARVARRH